MCIEVYDHGILKPKLEVAFTNETIRFSKESAATSLESISLSKKQGYACAFMGSYSSGKSIISANLIATNTPESENRERRTDVSHDTGKPDVFISYNHSDCEYKNRILQLSDLHASSKTFFSDELPTGEQWYDRVCEAIQQCEAVVILLTGDYIFRQSDNQLNYRNIELIDLPGIENRNSWREQWELLNDLSATHSPTWLPNRFSHGAKSKGKVKQLVAAIRTQLNEHRPDDYGERYQRGTVMHAIDIETSGLDQTVVNNWLPDNVAAQRPGSVTSEPNARSLHTEEKKVWPQQSTDSTASNTEQDESLVQSVRQSWWSASDASVEPWAFVPLIGAGISAPSGTPPANPGVWDAIQNWLGRNHVDPEQLMSGFQASRHEVIDGLEYLGGTAQAGQTAWQMLCRAGLRSQVMALEGDERDSDRLELAQRLASGFGIETRFDNDENVPACLIRMGRHKVIVIFDGLPDAEKTWLVCHEVAHERLNHRSDNCTTVHDTAHDRRESEAEALASLWCHFMGLKIPGVEPSLDDDDQQNHVDRSYSNFDLRRNQDERNGGGRFFRAEFGTLQTDVK